VNIACSDKDSEMFFENDGIYSDYFCFYKSCWNIIEIETQDLALYTHWPRHTKEFWDLLNEP